MHNVHVSRSERESRQPASVEDEHLESSSIADGAPYDISTFQGMDEQLVRAMEALPSEYQVVMMLWAIDELSYKEIAESVGIPIGTVMSRLHRARQKLSEQLREYARREGIIRE